MYVQIRTRDSDQAYVYVDASQPAKPLDFGKAAPDVCGLGVTLTVDTAATLVRELAACRLPSHYPARNG